MSLVRRPSATPAPLKKSNSEHSSAKMLTKLQDTFPKKQHHKRTCSDIARKAMSSAGSMAYTAISSVVTNPVTTGLGNQLGRTVRWVNTTQRLQNYAAQQAKLRFPKTAFLKENQWNNISSKDGYGTSKAFHLAADLALKSPDGRAIINIGGQTALFITQSSDIAQVMYHNQSNISRDAVFDVFSSIYSAHSVFAIQKGEQWRAKRNTLVKWLFVDEKKKENGERPLAELAKPMQDIIDEFIEKRIKPTLSSKVEVQSQSDKQAEKKTKESDEKKQEIDLGKFCSQLTMDLIARTRLGTKSLAPHIDEFEDAFENAFTQIINIENITNAKIAQFTQYLFLKLKVNNIDIAKEKVLRVFREFVLKPNRDLILNTENLLKTVVNEEQVLRDDPTITIDSDEIASQGAFLLLGGHETTSRLLQFALMLLSAHPDILAKLRKQINDYRTIKGDGEWTRDDLEELPFLSDILNETLRLYPPAPTIGRGVDKSFVLAKLDRFNAPSSSAEYKSKMEKRNKADDIELKSGHFMPDLIIIPQFAAHRSHIEYLKPDEFIPERFDPKRTDLRPAGQKEIDDTIFFPFGLADRACIGKRIALQETSLAILKIVSQFDMKLPDEVKYPFPVVHRGTIKSPEPVKVRFIPLQKEARAELKVAQAPGTKLTY